MSRLATDYEKLRGTSSPAPAETFRIESVMVAVPFAENMLYASDGHNDYSSNLQQFPFLYFAPLFLATQQITARIS